MNNPDIFVWYSDVINDSNRAKQKTTEGQENVTIWLE